MENDDTKEIEELQKQASRETWIALGAGIPIVILVWVIAWCLLWWRFAPDSDDFCEKSALALSLLECSESVASVEVLKLMDEPKWVEAGTFGDMFGCLNTLLTGFAFAGLIATLCRERANMRVSRKMFEIQEKHYREQQMVTLKRELDAALFRYAEFMNTLLKEIPDGQIDNVVANMKKMPDFLQRYRDAKIDCKEIADNINELRGILNYYVKVRMIFISWVKRIESQEELHNDLKAQNNHIGRLWNIHASSQMFMIYLSSALCVPEDDSEWLIMDKYFSNFYGVKMFFRTCKYDAVCKDVFMSLLHADNDKYNAYLALETSVVEKTINRVLSQHNS